MELAEEEMSLLKFLEEFPVGTPSYFLIQSFEVFMTWAHEAPRS